MEIREALKTAIAIMDEKGRSDGNNRMLWARDWEHLRELLIVGLVSIANKPVGAEPNFDVSSGSLAVVGGPKQVEVHTSCCA